MKNKGNKRLHTPSLYLCFFASHASHFPFFLMPHYKDIGMGYALCSLLFPLFFMMCHPYIPLHFLHLYTYTHMVMDYLVCVVSLSVSVELTKVIHQWPHAGRNVNHSVHQLSQWDPPCNDCPISSCIATYNVCMQHTEFLLCLCFPHIEPKTSRA